jgi:uncharacterized protein YkwD
VRGWGFAAAGLLTLHAGTAGADLPGAANRARLRSCGGVSARLPLRENSRLGQAAMRLAGGTSLREAMAAAGYRASRSASIHLSGIVRDDEVTRILSLSYCKTLGDPELQDMGVAHRGRDIWIVLAAPVTVPGPGDAAADGKQVQKLVNQARAQPRRCGGRQFAPVGPLKTNAALSRAALEHSRDMALHDRFDHTGHDGSTPSVRIARAGYGEFRIVGENIAAGAMTPAEAVQGWLASPAHCENIMDGRFAEMGFAYSVNPDSPSVVYWTQVFASPRD